MEHFGRRPPRGQVPGDDKYYISLLVETDIKPLPKTDKAIGLDLGVKDLVIDSNGFKYKNHKYLAKSEDKLAREQRKMDKMKKGSSNRNKQRIKVARIYRKINNQRNDYLHKLTKYIINENQVICVEDLKVKDPSLTRLRGSGGYPQQNNPVNPVNPVLNSLCLCASV